MWANKNHNKGFTIVETLIVLAITALLFLATSFLVRGQIQRQQYKLGINEQLSLLRDTANDVQTGYYPDVLNLTNVVCAGTASSVNSSNQGQNGDCILVGKRITFNQTNMTIDTLVDGKSKTGPSGSTTTVSTIKQTVPYPNSMTVTSPVPKVVNIMYATYPALATTKSGSLGVVQLDGTYATINDANQTKICFTDGKKKGSITFGYKDSLVPYLVQEDSSC